MRQVLVIDNYDSFTFNLVHYLEGLDCAVTVFRNDEFDLDDAKPYDRILLSPGPGIPAEAGLLKELIANSKHKSILGVCLGQQAIAEVFGAGLINLGKVYHGVEATISITDGSEPMFAGLPKQITVGRYHSWSVARELCSELLATSFDNDGEIMSLRHKTLNIRGVQFHPESVMTPFGKTILANWLEIPVATR